MKLKASRYLENDKGFTLIEALISLFVVSLTLFLLNSLVLNIQTFVPKTNHPKQVEWHIFLHQLPDEIEGYGLEYAGGRELVFRSEQGAIVYIYLRNGRVIRQVNYEGHQPLLMDVKNIDYEVCGENQVSIDVEFLTGEQYSAVLSVNTTKEE